MDTKNWKEFRVGDLFTPYLGGNPSSSKISDFGKYAIITASSDNNGISGYTDCYQEGLVFSNIITLGNRGSYNAFYHPYDVYLGNNVLALEEKFEMTENQKLFITTLINKFHYDGYTNYPTKANIVEEILLLPTKDDKPDFEYMEEYIEEIKLKYVDRLEKDNNENIDKVLRVTGLSYADLNKDLTVKPADRYEEFRVGDLFETSNKNKTKVLTGAYLSKDILNNNLGDIPRITVTSYNNGVSGYYKENINDFNYRVYENFISVSFLGDCFYQKDKASLDMKVHCLKLRDYEITSAIGLYIATILKKAIQMYSYGSQLSSEKLADVSILLPTIDKGTPDFDYMEKAIYIYTAKKIKLEKLFNEKKIKLVRRLINE